MNFLLDTCVVSGLAKPGLDPKVLAWVESEDEVKMYISALTLGELQKDVSKLPESVKKAQLQAWIQDDLLERFAGRVLAPDAEVCMRWGILQAEMEKQGRPMPVIDSLIAATALHHRLTVITLHARDMEASGVALFNPWGVEK